MDTTEMRETERLLLAMAASARHHPNTIGSAITTWEAANVGKDVGAYLRADILQLARLSVTPSPSRPTMPKQAMDLANELGIDGFALVNMLRFAASATAMTEAEHDGERLLAALDHDDADEGKTTS